VVIAVNVLLLRRVFGPLERLATLMRHVNPQAPGRRLPVEREVAEVADVCEAFNGMLDRLEHERRMSGRRALTAQESERRRLAAHPASPLLPAVDDVRAILTGTRVWAVVGCSPDPGRDSHRIAALLQRRGYRVVPVNPRADEILGERCHPSLQAVRDRVDVVDVIRRASEAGAHVDEAVAVGARAVWMQLGVVDEAAAERARAAGLRVVMDRCPAIELPGLERRLGWTA
jgi:predicted CoA-binding protein/HAMP domain-containing protein